MNKGKLVYTNKNIINQEKYVSCEVCVSTTRQTL